MNQMQFSLEDIISMLLQRVEALSASDENNKTKQNIINRVLYKKGLLTKEDILESVKQEYAMLKELGAIKELPSDEIYETTACGIIQWISGDVEGIKKSMDEYQKKLEELARQEAAKKPKIEVANANVLSQLDAATKGKPGKLII